MVLRNKCTKNSECNAEWDCINEICRNKYADSKILTTQIIVCMFIVLLLFIGTHLTQGFDNQGSLLYFKFIILIAILIIFILLIVTASDRKPATVKTFDSYTHSVIITRSILWGIGLVLVRRVASPIVNSKNVSQHLYDCVYGSIAIYVMSIIGFFIEKYALVELDKHMIQTYY